MPSQGLTMVQSVALRYASMATQTDPLDLRVRGAGTPSPPVVVYEDRFDLVSLEIVNSGLAYKVGIHWGNAMECLAILPEPYEILPSGPI